MFSFFKKTKSILGMNGRNFLYLKPYNPKHARINADDKLRTKSLLVKAGLPVAETYSVISNQKELHDFDFESLPKSFVIKPNMGFGGDGIKVIFGRKKDGTWISADQSGITKENISFHIHDILDGFYSMTHAPDVAFFEQRIKIHSDLKLYSFKGIPDIRIIVFNGIPIMAMLRLPTKQSGGKANLMMGGIGVGIDISRGITTHAVIKKKFFGELQIEYLPGTKIPLRGIQIPFWDHILDIAIRAGSTVGLGYTGIDIALDKDLGPIILEVNARPGLSIQNANRAALGERLNRVIGLEVKTVKKGIKIAKELFGGEIQQELEEISGKDVLGIIEKVIVYGKNNIEKNLQVKIDTGAASSSIDIEIATELGFGDAINFARKFGAFRVGNMVDIHKLYESSRHLLKQHSDIFDVDLINNSNGSSVRMVIQLEFMLGKKKISSRINVMDRGNMRYPMIIGRSDLKQFLIDPGK